MSWTTPGDLRAQLQRLWDQGRILASLVDDEPLFPLRLNLKGPGSADLAQRFDEVRNWITTLRRAEARGYRIVWREVQHRVIGSNALPAEIWVDDLDHALTLLGQRREAECFKALVAETAKRHPALLVWLKRRPLKALELAPHWSHFLAIASWLLEHPRPGIYLRQVDIPGIHSKFIEAHRGVLAELLDRVLPSAVIDGNARGAHDFCRRYGFRDKPLRVRFRLLDPRSALLPTGTDQDLAVNQDTFARLDLRIERVFITENEINYLAFPACNNSVVIFGAGYGFEHLAEAAWLDRCRIHYWGDIDTHGFAILDQLRAYFPHAQSFLMDRATFIAHEAYWTREPQPVYRALPRLNAEEGALYDDLVHDRLGSGIRLEQERVGFCWLEAALDAIER